MKTKAEIIEEFNKGHKGEEMMEVAEASAEVQIALEKQAQEIVEEIINIDIPNDSVELGVLRFRERVLKQLNQTLTN